MSLEPLSPTFLSLATATGLPEKLAVALWEKYAADCERNGFQTNARAWDKWVKRELGRYDQLRKQIAAEERAEERRREEQKLKRADDEAYALQAISLPEYLDSLITKPSPTAAELRLLEFPAPAPGADVGAWMMAAFKGYRLPAQERPAKACVTCVGGVSRWVSQNRVYEAATCDQCGRAERLERMRLKVEAEQENRR